MSSATRERLSVIANCYSFTTKMTIGTRGFKIGRNKRGKEGWNEVTARRRKAFRLESMGHDMFMGDRQ